MNILYDYQVLLWQKYGGISRYFYELASRLSEKEQVAVPVFSSVNYYFEKFFDKASKDKQIPHTYRLVEFVNRYLTKKELKRQIDIFHPTYYSDYFLNYKSISEGKTKFILTVHDMTHEIFPQYFSADDKTAELKRKLIIRADKIIAISENTKKDILHFIPETDPEKISVIYHSSSLRCDSGYKSKIDFPDKYILFVGQRSGYKNFEALAKAFSLVSKKKHDIMLLCVGGGTAFTAEEYQLLDRLGIADKVTHMRLGDNDLCAAYSNALCFVFPSLYEGFGIPVLEAMANSCPAVLARASCLEEIGGDGAVYFDPYNEKELADIIFELNEEKRRDMISKGRRRSECFSWEKTTAQTLELYRQALK